MKILYLEDAHALVKTFGLVEEGHCYMGKIDAKKDKSIGVYNLNGGAGNNPAIGGDDLRSYAVKRASILVHWNRSPRDTEKAALDLYWRLRAVRDVTINEKKIKFIKVLSPEPVDVGTDEAGIYERVIETEIYYER